MTQTQQRNGPLPECEQCERTGATYGVRYLYTAHEAEQGTERIEHYFECSHGHVFTDVAAE